MNDLIPHSKKEYQGFKLPEYCGVRGCRNKCEIFIDRANISRCAEHYTQDLSDRYHNSPKIVGQFYAPTDTMEALKELGLDQNPEESIKEYGKRCRSYLKTLDNGYSKLVKA